MISGGSSGGHRNVDFYRAPTYMSRHRKCVEKCLAPVTVMLVTATGEELSLKIRKSLPQSRISL